MSIPRWVIWEFANVASLPPLANFVKLGRSVIVIESSKPPEQTYAYKRGPRVQMIIYSWTSSEKAIKDSFIPHVIEQLTSEGADKDTTVRRGDKLAAWSSLDDKDNAPTSDRIVEIVSTLIDNWGGEVKVCAMTKEHEAIGEQVAALLRARADAAAAKEREKAAKLAEANAKRVRYIEAAKERECAFKNTVAAFNRKVNAQREAQFQKEKDMYAAQEPAVMAHIALYRGDKTSVAVGPRFNERLALGDRARFDGPQEHSLVLPRADKTTGVSIAEHEVATVVGLGTHFTYLKLQSSGAIMYLDDQQLKYLRRLEAASVSQQSSVSQPAPTYVYDIENLARKNRAVDEPAAAAILAYIEDRKKRCCGSEGCWRQHTARRCPVPYCSGFYLCGDCKQCESCEGRAYWRQYRTGEKRRRLDLQVCSKCGYHEVPADKAVRCTCEGGVYVCHECLEDEKMVPCVDCGATIKRPEPTAI